MLKYKIKQVINLDKQIIADKAESHLKATGYHICQKTETSISFDNDSKDFEIVSQGYFFDKANRGKIEFREKQEGSVIELNYFISLEPLFMLILMLVIGAVVVSYKVFFLSLIVVAVFVYRIYSVKRSMLKILRPS